MFELANVFFGINQHGHFALIRADMEEKEIVSYNSIPAYTGDDQICLKHIQTYLEYEHKKIYKGEPLPAEWSVRSEKSVPRQHGENDVYGKECLVFTCINTLALLTGMQLDYTQEDVTNCQFRKRIALALLLKAGLA